MQNDKQYIIDFIQRIFPMPGVQAQEIISVFKEKHLSKNDLFLKEGKVCNEYCFIKEGFLRAYTFDLEGNEVTTAFFSKNSIAVDIFSFFKRVPAGESIQALSDCTLHFIDYDELQHAFHSLPQFREMGRGILVNAYAQLKQRMLSMLHQTAEQRYAHLLQTNPEVFQHAPLKYIASYLGITDTSLSRIRREFSKSS